MNKLIIALFLSVFVHTASAQDAHLSMYDAAPLYLNPALTGVMDGDFRLHAQYRTQWKAVNFKPYTSILASFDMPIKKWSFGIQISNFRAGFGNFNVIQGLLSTSYNTAIDKRKNNFLSFGVQAGVMQKSLEHQLLSFNNQYNLSNGGDFDQTIVSGENFGAQSVVLPAVNVSGIYYFAKQKSRLNPFIGFSAFNLLNSKESLFGQDNRLPFRYYIHAGTRINITELLYVIPKVLIMQQGTFNEQTFAAEVGYFLKGSETYLLGGVIYRNKDALVATLGFKKAAFIFKVGYDFNLSSLTSASTGRGGLELSLTYTHKKKNSVSDKICPRL
ncbi:MAG: PorP/SprF family type IX secretion system membrane protein [Crocinitomicaceae bacterium]